MGPCGSGKTVALAFFFIQIIFVALDKVDSKVVYLVVDYFS